MPPRTQGLVFTTINSQGMAIATLQREFSPVLAVKACLIVDDLPTRRGTSHSSGCPLQVVLLANFEAADPESVPGA